MIKIAYSMITSHCMIYFLHIAADDYVFFVTINCKKNMNMVWISLQVFDDYFKVSVTKQELSRNAKIYNISCQKCGM